MSSIALWIYLMIVSTLYTVYSMILIVKRLTIWIIQRLDGGSIVPWDDGEIMQIAEGMGRRYRSLEWSICSIALWIT